jgi:hypothetical protein
VGRKGFAPQSVILRTKAPEKGWNAVPLGMKLVGKPRLTIQWLMAIVVFGGLFIYNLDLKRRTWEIDYGQKYRKSAEGSARDEVLAQRDLARLERVIRSQEALL